MTKGYVYAYLKMHVGHKHPLVKGVARRASGVATKAVLDRFGRFTRLAFDGWTSETSFWLVNFMSTNF